MVLPFFCASSAAKEKDGSANLIALSGLVGLITLVFFKVVFLGQSVSRLHLLAEWDSVYGAFKTGQSYASDPSIMQLLLPYYFTVQHVLASGQLPLWNPYNAFGAPLLADIQSFAFSPLRLLFYIHPSIYTYNITLVIEVALCAVFSYLLARSIGTRVAGSLLCGFAYPLCPMILYYAELATGTSNFLLPLVLWSFVRLARSMNFLGCAIAALASSLTIVSGHPEGSFFAISFGVLLLAVVRPILKHESGGTLKAFGCVALTALLTLGLTAPVLFPFAEYAANADSYKFSVGKSAFVEWYGVVLSLMQPGFAGASPYLGIAVPISLSLVPFLSRERRRLALSLFALSLMALALVSRLGFLDAVLSTGPLVCIVTLYCLPVFLLLLLLVAGLGFDELCGLAAHANRARTMAVTAAALATLSIPLALYLSHVPLSSCDFDMTIPHMNFASASFVRDGGIVLAGFALIWLLHRSRRGGWAKPALLALAFMSELAVARTSLPVRPPFAFPQTPLLTRLQEEKVRVLPLGEYILRPNSNWVYGISQLRCHNPIFPRGFFRFEELSGGKRMLFEHTFNAAPENRLAASLVGCIITDKPPSQWQGALEHDRFKLVYTSPENIGLYKNTLSLPRAYFSGHVQSVASHEQALAAVAAPQFDPFATAIVETADTTDSGARFGQGPGGIKEASLTEADNNRVKCVVDCKSAGALVLTDTFYPGWIALVDGAERPIRRANGFFRAVFLEPGVHSVTFEYRPRSFWLGVICNAVALLAVIVSIMLSMRSKLPVRSAFNGVR